jgi:hypothetical protein
LLERGGMLKAAVVLCTLLAAPATTAPPRPDTSFYVGTGGAGDVSVFALGKRTVDRRAGEVNDVQLLMVPGAAPLEVRYQFKLDSRKLLVWVGDKSIGQGTFEVEGDRFHWNRVKYDYTQTLPGVGSQHLTGSDDYSKPGALYFADAVTPGKDGKPSRWHAEMKSVSRELYEALRTRLQK